MRALRADDAEGVVYLGTFSKTFAAGVRVGWAVARRAIRDKLILAAESAVLCHSSFSQLTVREYLNTQPWHEQIKDFRELYRERRDATLGALSGMMPPGCHWTRPAGGFYVWLRLPEGINAKAMLPRAISVASRLRAGHRLLRRWLGRPVRPALLLASPTRTGSPRESAGSPR